MTTSLIWFVRELLKPIEAYRDDSKKYDDYKKAEPLFSRATAKKTSETVPVVAQPILATSATSNVEEAESWFSYSTKLVAAPVSYFFSSPEANQASGQSSTETKISLFDRAYVGIASLGVNIDLKAKKFSEATLFIKAIEEALYQHVNCEKDAIRSRIGELQALHATELKRIDELLQLNDARLGDYDALLKVFGSVLNEGLKSDILTALTITLKLEAVPPTPHASLAVDRTTQGHGKKNKANEVTMNLVSQPIPELRELCSFLMQQIMQLRIDEARSEQPRLKHARLLENPYSPKIVTANLDAIRALDSIQNKYGSNENDVLMHTIDVLGKIVLKNKEISEALGSTNKFMLESLEHLQGKLTTAETLQRDREHQKLALGSSSPCPNF